MKRFLKLLIFVTLIFSIVAPTSSALAAGYDAPHFDDKVVFGGTFTVEEGEVFNGNIVVLGGVVTVEEGAVVNGDIIVLGGNVNIDGEVDNSLIAIGGVVNLGSTVVIWGDMIAPASVVNRDDGAVIEGQIITDAGFIDFGNSSDPIVPDFNNPAPISPAERVFTPVVEMLWLMFQTFFISAIAVLMSLFFTDQLGRIKNVISVEPVIAGGLGLFTFVVLIVLVIFLALLSVFIITIPLTVLGIVVLTFAFVAAGFMGWVALGMELGQRVGVMFKQNWAPALQSGIGTFMLTFLVGSFGIVFWDFLGSVFMFVISAIGIGAVVLTRYGTRDYVSSREEDEELVPEIVEEVEETVSSSKKQAKPKK